MKAVITVIGRDSTGIIAKVSTILANAQINIDDMSQTIMQGIFTMVMLVDLSHGTVSLDVLQEELTKCGQTLGTDIRIQRAEVFTAMHQI